MAKSTMSDIDEDFKEDDDEMDVTISRAHSHMQPMLIILKQACIQDLKGSNKRQLDFAVQKFRNENPHISHQNFYEKSFDLVTKIRDARCFFMLLKQLRGTSRIVSTRERKKTSLTLYVYMLKYQPLTLLVCIIISNVIAWITIQLFHNTQDSIWNLPPAADGKDPLTELISVQSPFQTYVEALTNNTENDSLMKGLGAKRRKNLNKYVTDFHLELQRLDVSTQTASHTTTTIQESFIEPDTTTSASISSMGNTTSYSSSNMDVDQTMSSSSSLPALLGAPSNSTLEIFDPAVAQTTKITQTKIIPTTSLPAATVHGVCELSPISQHSNHQIDESDIQMDSSFNGDVENIKTHDHSFLLYMDPAQGFCVFSDNEDVPQAKSFHMYTNTDLQPVQCTASFLYLVFRNPLLFEVSFFKVKVYIHMLHMYNICHVATRMYLIFCLSYSRLGIERLMIVCKGEILNKLGRKIYVDMLLVTVVIRNNSGS